MIKNEITLLPIQTVCLQAYKQGQWLEQNDTLIEEVPIALVYNGLSHVVMMASPQQLDDFALGFSLAEGIIQDVSEIYHIEPHSHPQGIELHIELASARFMALKQRRRQMAGRTGCGICGTEQLAEIHREFAPLPFTQQFSLSLLPDLLNQLSLAQSLSQATACTHAAAWFNSQGQLLHISEDVGRHVALDKLIGQRARQTWVEGVAMVTSRASYEMVQKAASAGVEILIALGAPTALAVQMAKHYQLTLLGFARKDRVNVYSWETRVLA